ncbi:glutathione S-transferase 1: isoform D-like protein, partial [Dinothrombium tinctorium]
MAIKLYYTRISAPCRAVILTARYLNIPLELIEVDLLRREQMREEFLAINPRHCVPTIDDDGFILWESRAIMQYFVNKYAPGNEIYSEDPMKRACIDRMLYFDCGVFAATHIRTIVPLLYEGKFPGDYEITKIMENLRILDGILAKDGFVAGPTLTLPDITMAAYASTMQVYDVEILKFKNIARWFQALEDVLPDFKEINEENVKIYKQMLENGEFKILQSFKIKV